MDMKKAFYTYLEKIGKADERVIQQLEMYSQLLIEENKKINLFSRQMTAEEIWSVHFMDSISLAEVYPNISDEIILDFGTGGGLPGIPINIIFPENKLVFLDSKQKKMSSVKNICKKLDLKEVNFVCSRIEEIDSVWYGKFDRIVCRSVKIKPLYAQFLMKLLKKEGIINLYKAKQLDDVLQFKSYQIFNVSNEILGERRIVEIKHD